MRRNPIAPVSAPASSVGVAEPPPAVASPTSPSSLKKVSFGKIAAKKDDSKTAFPIFPDESGEAALIAARILERTEQLEALQGALETDKAELKMRCTPYYFTVNSGRHEVPSSVSVASAKGDVLVTFQNRYPLLPDDAPLLGVLGSRTSAFFRQSFELKIKGDKLPESKTQELLNELQALFEKYGATDALEVKDGVKPAADFHAARHLQLTPQENLAVDQVCPVVTMIKTKGRK